jgi:hypothetical protein
MVKWMLTHDFRGKGGSTFIQKGFSSTTRDMTSFLACPAAATWFNLIRIGKYHLNWKVRSTGLSSVFKSRNAKS